MKRAQLRDDIAQAADRMKTTLNGKREIRSLAGHLLKDERVLEMAVGSYGGGLGILALTDRRLFFWRNGWVGKTSEDFPIERVQSVGLSSKLMASVTIRASGLEAEITHVPNADAERLVSAARQRLT